MKKGIIQKTISIILSLLFVGTMTMASMAATFESDFDTQEGMQEIAISTTAGESGVYVHNIDTGETDFLPPTEYENSTEVTNIVCEEKIEEDSFVEPRVVDNFVPINAPSGRYASTCLMVLDLNKLEKKM